MDFYRTEKEGQDRIENLEELVNAAEASSPRRASARTRWRDCRSTSNAAALPAQRAAVPDADTGEIMSPLAAFLTHASLEAGDNQAQAGQDAVQLMTVHAAKGLEFDAVFITGSKKACSRTRTR
jgi:DNA helicase-2/ATP-dependent DNA helicase PcrA